MGGTLANLDPNVAPNTPPTSGWTAVGGTIQAVLADASDATYIHDGVIGSGATRIQQPLSQPALPAGAAIKYVYGKIRASQAAGTKRLTTFMRSQRPSDGVIYYTAKYTFQPTAVIQDFQIIAAGAVAQSKSQETIDNLWIDTYLEGGGPFVEDHRLYKMYGVVVYVDAPTASGTALSPSNANTLTTRPSITWAYSSTDALTQYEYQVVIWKLADINLFTGGRAAFEGNVNNIFVNRISGSVNGPNFTGTDAANHAATWVSALTSTGATDWTVSNDNIVTPTTDLDGTSAYVAYVRVSSQWQGERLAGTQYDKLDFTQTITLPAQPSTITAVWQRDFQFQTKIDVTVIAETLGVWTGRKVIVERRIVGAPATEWRVIPAGTVEMGASAGTFTVYDTLAAVGRTLEYRARSVFWSSLGYEASGLRKTSASIVADFNAFVLRDPLSVGSAVVFRIQGDLEATQDEVLGIFRPLGQQYPVVISDRVLGRRWQAQVRVKDTLPEAFLDVLRSNQSQLVLQTDMQDTWYWVRFGPSMSKRILRQTDRTTASKREQTWGLELIEVQAVPGQPQVYF